MATYTYRPQAAVGENGQLTNVGTGQLFAITDTSFTTPLVARDVAGASKSVIALSGIGQTETFLIDDHPELWWKSGSVVVHLFSVTGILENMAAAVASAAASATASNVSRAAAEAAQSAVATLMEAAVLSVNGAFPDANGNVQIATGGGGGGSVVSVAGVNPDVSGNVPLTAANVGAAASGHTHTFASKNGLTGVTGTATSSTFLRGDGVWAAPPTGGGGGGVVSVNTVTPDGGGNVTLTKTNIGLGSVDNTPDAEKPLSTAMVEALLLKANDNAVVKVTGDQTVGGVKTFSSSPVVPNASFTIAKITNLQTTLDGKLTGLNGLTGIWAGTQAAYDAIGTKVATVLYFVTGA